MIYVDRNKLKILKTNNNYVRKDYLLNYVINSFTKKIYFENDSNIIGVIDLKNIINSKKYVKINKIHKSVNIEKKISYDIVKNYSEVVILKNKKIEGIFYNEYGISIMRYFYSQLNNYWSIQENYGKKICLVEPKYEFDYNDFLKVKEFLLIFDKEVDILNYKDLMNKTNDYDVIIFNSNFELEMFKIITHDIFKMNINNFYSYETFYEEFNEQQMNNYIYNIEKEFLLNLKKRGIKIFTLCVDESKIIDGISYEEYFNKKIKDKYESINMEVGNFIVYSKEFFDNLYSEQYEEEIKSIQWNQKNINGYNVLNNFNSNVCNIKNGVRNSICSNEKEYNKIHFFGPCLIIGPYVDDNHTISSYFQKRVNQDKKKFQVVNYGSWNDALQQVYLMNDIDFYVGDVIIAYMSNASFYEITNFEFVEDFYKENFSPYWFVDTPFHYNHKINKYIADKLYDETKDKLVNNFSKKIVEKDKSLKARVYINRYFDNYQFLNKKVGSIVMNCNPFTYGHKYLIMQALKQVDTLIIFVVSEDKSYFNFNTRFATVCAGVADLKNVIVVPSGEMILSQNTFPEYFVKTLDESIKKNVTNDIEFFANYIAPLLNIKYRFFGSEPKDLVTKEYNEAMLKILPSKGIKAVEIPRVQFDNDVISATKAREYLINGEYDKLKKLLPDSTIKIILNNFKIK